MKPGLCPDMPFYPTDWLSSLRVSAMTLAEQGAYFRLLAHAWSDPDCCLPDDDAILATLSCLGKEQWGAGSGKTIRGCFIQDPEHPAKIYNQRQRAVRREQEERIAGRVSRGKAAADARWSRSGESAPVNHAPKCLSNAQASSKHCVSITQASSKHMLGDASSHVPLLPSPVSQREGEGDTAIQLPEGFPRSPEEAAAGAASAGCTREFAIEAWNQSAARGGTDWSGNAVQSWPHYLASRAATERAKQAGKQTPVEPDHSKGF